MSASAAGPGDFLGHESQIERLLEWRVLKALHENEGALGSVRLQAMLLKQGYSISQTTVGRLLNRLDFLDYTYTGGPKQGRRLTDKGLSRLGELSYILDSEEHERQLLQSLRLQSLPDVVDFAHVRISIEGQAVRLATERVTDSQIEEMWGILARVRDLLAAGEHPMELNRLFHLKIAEYSGSKLIFSVLRFLYRDRDRLRVPPEIEQDNLRLSLEEHARILAAMAARDGEGAEKAMMAHHERTVQILEDYLATVAEGGPSVLEMQAYAD